MSSSNGLWILVEGVDDERFFESERITKRFNRWAQVRIYPYAQKENKKVNKFLRALSKIKEDYVFLTDLNHAPCITQRKNKKRREITNLDMAKVFVVVREIEAWYLAGLDKKSSKKLGIEYLRSTDEITKDAFGELVPKKFQKSHKNFKIEALKYFDFATAKRKNESFAYFADRFLA